jgi:hypothetical protein
MRDQILSWLRRRRERTRRIEVEASMLVRELGSDAYAEARLMQRKSKSTEQREYWRDVAMAVARITRKRVGLDTATRMTMDADFSDRREMATPEFEPQHVDPIDELMRIIGERETKPTPRRSNAPTNSTRRKRPERRR